MQKQSPEVIVCIGKMCDRRESCANHVHAIWRGTSKLTYRQSLQPGESCSWYEPEYESLSDLEAFA